LNRQVAAHELCISTFFRKKGFAMPTNMEKAASKAMGAAKKVKGAVKGLDGVFKTLMEEHGEVSAMLLKVKSSSDIETRARLWPTVRRELTSHEKGEVAVVFGAFQQNPETIQLALHHNEEAQELSSLIGAIDEMSFDDPMWEPKFDQLVKLVQHHVAEEEGEIFPAGQDALGAAKAEQLNEPYLAKKQDVMDQS